MDRMLDFEEEAPAVSLEVEDADELEVKVELTNQPKAKQDPFLPKKADRAEAFKPPKDKKPLSEKQKAHLERLRQKKIALREKRGEMADANSKEARKTRATAKKQEKSVQKAPVYPTALEGPSESEEEEEPEPAPAPTPKRKATPKVNLLEKDYSKTSVKRTTASVDEDADFEKFITNLDKFEKMKRAVDARERKIREQQEAKERALEEKIRAKIEAENKQRNNRNGNHSQPVPKTQSLLQTPQATDYGMYSNRYF